MSREEFKKRVLIWAGRIGVSPTRIEVRPMKKHFASCYESGRLVFNEKILSGVPSSGASRFIDEVIVHELVHLRVGTHSPGFRRLVDQYLRGS